MPLFCRRGEEDKDHPFFRKTLISLLFFLCVMDFDFCPKTSMFSLPFLLSRVSPLPFSLDKPSYSQILALISACSLTSLIPPLLLFWCSLTYFLWISSLSNHLPPWPLLPWFDFRILDICSSLWRYCFQLPIAPASSIRLPCSPLLFASLVLRNLWAKLPLWSPAIFPPFLLLHHRNNSISPEKSGK